MNSKLKYKNQHLKPGAFLYMIDEQSQKEIKREQSHS